MVRLRKRVRALRRAPYGSAFEKCEDCGASISVALADMHDCGMKKDVKRFRGASGTPRILIDQRFNDQPRSAFCFFMESYVSTFQGEDMIELNRKCSEQWRDMSKEERKPHERQAEKVNSAYLKTLLQEVNDMPHVDDEADSSCVGKYDRRYEDFDSLASYSSEKDESLDTCDWELMWPWAHRVR